MHRHIMTMSRVMAVMGGIVLTLLILLTCASVLGRSLNGIFHGDFMQGIAPGFSQWMLDLGVGPINGDFELVEAGVAFAIFAFIPLCQVTSGHASVDVFTNFLPKRFMRGMRAVTEVVFAIVLVLIAARLFEGMLSKRSAGETSFLLEFPTWWAYAASFVAAVTAAIAGVYMAGVRVMETLTGCLYLADGAEVDH